MKVADLIPGVKVYFIQKDEENKPGIRELELNDILVHDGGGRVTLTDIEGLMLVERDIKEDEVVDLYKTPQDAAKHFRSLLK